MLEPPSDGQTAVAPMKSVLSSSGCLSESFCTAATPSTLSRSATLFAGTCRRDAAVHGRVGLVDLRARHGVLDRGRDLSSTTLVGVLVVGLHRSLVVLERLARDRRARRREARDAAGVGRGRVEVVLDHDVDRVRARAPEQRRIGLGERAGDRLVGDERRVRRQSVVAVNFDGAALPATADRRAEQNERAQQQAERPCMSHAYPFPLIRAPHGPIRATRRLSARPQGNFAADRIVMVGQPTALRRTHVSEVVKCAGTLCEVRGCRRSKRPSPRSRRRRAQTIVIGVPTGISRDSFRIDSFGMRMQPCET